MGRGVPVAELLLAHGADPRRACADGRTPYELAMRAGNLAVAELLRAKGGAVEPLRPIDAVLSACAVPATKLGRGRCSTPTPDCARRCSSRSRTRSSTAAGAGMVAAVRTLAALGFDLGRESPWGGTPLHMAAWRGRIRQRARADRRRSTDQRPRQDLRQLADRVGRPWVRELPGSGRRLHRRVIDLLLTAGAEREPSFNRWKDPPENLSSDAVADYYRARGFAPEE